jgi:hypothetical protein
MPGGEIMWNNFWSDFFANFFSDILVGGLLGALLAWWIGKRLNESDRMQQHKEDRKAEIERTLRYLELLKNEIIPILQELPEKSNASQPFLGPEKIRIPTPFWNVLQPSGELPRLIEPELLSLLTKFYDELAHAKLGRDWLLTRLVNSDVTQIHSLAQDEIENVIKVGIQQGLKVGVDLPSKLDSEIKRLREQMEGLR